MRIDVTLTFELMVALAMYIITYWLVRYFWQSYERKKYGKANPQAFHTVLNVLISLMVFFLTAFVLQTIF